MEFICDPDKTGLEHDEFQPEDKYKDGGKDKRNLSYRADEGAPSNSTGSLRFVSYGPETDGSAVDVLRLDWMTKYACEGQKDKDDAEKTARWGFFTWFLIMQVSSQSSSSKSHS